MPEGFGYGGDEVKATTHNKTVKKATSQLERPSRLGQRALGPGLQSEEAFRERVDREVSDPSTRADVLKAAGVTRLPGVGISSTPPTKAPTPAPAPAKPKTITETRRARDMLRAAGFSAGEIAVFLSKSPQARRDHGHPARAQTREKFLRRQAAKKYGTPP